MMLSLVRPRFFVPIHGEHRHLVRHAMLASSIGVPESNSFVLEDGDVLELTAERAEVVGSVPAGHVFVDGQHRWGSNSAVLGERRRLAREGVVTVSVTLDSRTGLLVGAPNIGSVGFVELNESQDLFENTSKITANHLEEMGRSVLNLEQVKAAIRKSVSDFLYKETRRRPTVLATVEKV